MFVLSLQRRARLLPTATYEAAHPPGNRHLDTNATQSDTLAAASLAQAHHGLRPARLDVRSGAAALRQISSAAHLWASVLLAIATQATAARSARGADPDRAQVDARPASRRYWDGTTDLASACVGSSAVAERTITAESLTADPS